MTDLLSAIRWWAALTLLGLVALPLVYTLLRPLPDRGYAFVKTAGLLLVSFVFWLAGSLGLAGNDGGGIVLALVVVGAASLLAYRRRAPDDVALGDWLRANCRRASRIRRSPANWAISGVRFNQADNCVKASSVGSA